MEEWPTDAERRDGVQQAGLLVVNTSIHIPGSRQDAAHRQMAGVLMLVDIEPPVTDDKLHDTIVRAAGRVLLPQQEAHTIAVFVRNLSLINKYPVTLAGLNEEGAHQAALDAARRGAAVLVGVSEATQFDRAPTDHSAVFYTLFKTREV